MNIDTLLKDWASYELRRLESGGGYPKQTSISSWLTCQSHNSFGSSTPKILNDLTEQIVKVRGLVADLPTKQKEVIWLKCVGLYPIPFIALEILQIPKSTCYWNFNEAKIKIAKSFNNA